ncbi:MAG: DUF3473 domain-containing protein [Phycisphaerales bacterium]|nr:DUF3473 domain-containing protein [Phycisphaerales bacterium]
MSNLPTALLSFDIEEFDSPNAYGANLDHAEQLAQGCRGWERTLKLLEELAVPATFFTTAAIANHAPELLRKSAVKHEIASHGFHHATLAVGDLQSSRELLERLSGTPVLGFRRARMEETAPETILSAGYRWDSSIHPVWLPGRYNNRHMPRTIHRRSALIEVPASATPNLRLPVFWLAFKNYPQCLYRRCIERCLARDRYVNVYFHPWEFMNLSSARLPRYMRHPCGEQLCDRFADFIGWLRTRAAFSPISNYLAREGMLP